MKKGDTDPLRVCVAVSELARATEVGEDRRSHPAPGYRLAYPVIRPHGQFVPRVETRGTELALILHKPALTVGSIFL